MQQIQTVWDLIAQNAFGCLTCDAQMVATSFLCTVAFDTLSAGCIDKKPDQRVAALAAAWTWPWQATKKHHSLFCFHVHCLECNLRSRSTLAVDGCLHLARSCTCCPNPISLCSKITSVRQRKHCIPLAWQGSHACLSRSFLIIHILSLLRETRLCGWKQGQM